MSGTKVAVIVVGGLLVAGGAWYIASKSGTMARTGAPAGGAQKGTLVHANGLSGKSEFQSTVETVGQVAEFGKTIAGLFGSKSDSDEDE